MGIDGTSAIRAKSVEIVVPVHNEADTLKRQIETLVDYLQAQFPFPWKVTIVNNGSTDRTLEIAHELSDQIAAVSVVSLDRKGRGAAIREAWMNSTAEICCFMDADLSTGLDALLPLVAPLMTGHSDLAIGNRLSRTSTVARGPKRELISRIYNLMIQIFFSVRFSDAQCGFKAVRTDIAKIIVPNVKNNSWFFDTELLLLAEHNGLRIQEISVDWTDDPDSRVHIRSTVIEDIRGLCRVGITFLRGRGAIELGDLYRRPPTYDLRRQLVSFAKIGVLSTVFCATLFVGCLQVMHPVVANLLVLILVTPINFWLNRRLTFGHRTRSDRRERYVTSGVVFLGLVVISTIFLSLTVGSGHLVSLVVAVSCWTASSAVRFALLRNWVFKSR